MTFKATKNRKVMTGSSRFQDVDNELVTTLLFAVDDDKKYGLDVKYVDISITKEHARQIIEQLQRFVSDAAI